MYTRRNVRHFCAIWEVSEKELSQKWKLGRLSVFNTDEMNECERVIEMIKELSVNVKGFNESEKSRQFVLYFHYGDSIKCSF